MTPSAILSALSPNERAALDALSFDAAEFGPLARAWAEGRFPSNMVEGTIEPPPEGAIRSPAPVGTMQGDALVDAGLQLLQQGRVGLAVLNGGMATRFGGRVKGIVEALPGRSFLSLHLQRLRQAASGSANVPPLLVMNSVATEEPTLEHLRSHDYFGLGQDNVFCFTQSGAPRLREDGTIYRNDDGEISIYGPGHGDFLFSLRRSGAVQWLRERGVDTLLLANVDNLGASIEPQLLGTFAAEGAEMMVEVVDKSAGDAGGCPACVDGRVQLVENFAFPKSFDQQRIRVFNTNTLWFQTDALDREFPLRWYAVRKDVDGQSVVQFERLVGQASWFLRTHWVRIPRSRFLPVKQPDDLQALQPHLRQLFGTSLSVLN